MMRIVCILACVGLCSCAVKHDPIADLTEAQRLYSQGDYQAAVKGYEALVRLQPQDGELWFRLANSYVRINQPETAIEAYRNALLRNPNMAKAWHNLAEVHLKMALHAYTEGQKYIAADDPTLKVIESKQRQLRHLLEPSNDDR